MTVFCLVFCPFDITELHRSCVVVQEEPKLRISSAGGLVSMPVGNDEGAFKQDGTLIWVKRSDSGSSASPVTVMVEVRMSGCFVNTALNVFFLCWKCWFC